MREGVPYKGNRMPGKPHKREEKPLFPPPQLSPEMAAFLAEREKESLAAQRKLFGPPKPKPMSQESFDALMKLGDKAQQSYNEHGGNQIPGTNGYDSKENSDTKH